MEQWQQEIIRTNKTALINSTECSTTFIDTLYRRGVISKDEKESLECVKDRQGSTARSSLFYDIIVKKYDGFNILIKMCMEPTLAHEAVARLLIETAEEAGYRIFLPDVSSDSGSSSVVKVSSSSSRGKPKKRKPQDETNSAELREKLHHKARENKGSVLKDTSKLTASSAGGTSSSSSTPKNVKRQTNRMDLGKLPEALHDMVRYGKPLTFESEEPEKRQYAFILNIIKFKEQAGEENGKRNRLGAWKDTDNLVKLLEFLNFKIFPERKAMLYGEKWKKQDILEELKKFKKECIDDKVDSILVFFGSHGGKGFIQTSDLDYLDVYGDIIYNVQVGETEVGKRVPKIFINQSCQKDFTNPPRFTDTKGQASDSLYVTAQIPKCTAARDVQCGTYFVNALVYVLMNNAQDTSLQNMLKEVQKRLQEMGKLYLKHVEEPTPEDDEIQMSTSKDLGLKNDFYFFEDY